MPTDVVTKPILRDPVPALAGLHEVRAMLAEQPTDTRRRADLVVGLDGSAPGVPAGLLW